MKETDIWGLEPVSTNGQSLKQAIKLHGREMCPPTEAALIYNLHEYYLGFDELKEFVDSIGKYEREEYKVPIRLLGE